MIIWRDEVLWFADIGCCQICTAVIIEVMTMTSVFFFFMKCLSGTEEQQEARNLMLYYTKQHNLESYFQLLMWANTGKQIYIRSFSFYDDVGRIIAKGSRKTDRHAYFKQLIMIDKMKKCVIMFDDSFNSWKKKPWTEKNDGDLIMIELVKTHNLENAICNYFQDNYNHLIIVFIVNRKSSIHHQKNS
jgi:hypothetical protein